MTTSPSSVFSSRWAEALVLGFARHHGNQQGLPGNATVWERGSFGPAVKESGTRRHRPIFISRLGRWKEEACSALQF